MKSEQFLEKTMILTELNLIDLYEHLLTMSKSEFVQEQDNQAHPLN